MKKLLLFCAAVCTGLMSVAQLNQVVVEPYTLANAASVQPAGTTTYRIYAEMANPADLVTAVFAINNCHPLDVSTTTTFFNDAVGGVNPSGINPAFFAFFPNLEADSWVTVGVENSTSPGAADINQASTVPVDPWTASVNNPGGGSSLIMDDGAWFTLPTSASALPSGPNNRVLLGQFTTDGDLSFNINVQAFLNGDQANGRVDYVWSAPCSAGGTQTGFESENITLTYPAAAVPGCTDPLACNYDAAATADDGSCDLGYAFDMVDSFGDGWNFGTYQVYDVADPLNPVLVASGDLDNAQSGDGVSFGTDILCLADGCYNLVVGGSDYDGEIGWTLNGVDAGPLTGGSPADVSFSINTVCAVFGCTDVAACNYDPAATDDDGSCILPAANDLSSGAISISGTGTMTIDNTAACNTEGFAGSCHFGADPEGNSIWYTFTTSADAAISFETVNPVGWTDTQFVVYDAAFNEVGCDDDNGVGLLSLVTFACGDLAAGTYYLQVDGYAGSNGTVDLNYSIDEAACLIGCTDPNAVNYDAAATVDDGSCVVPTCAPTTPDNFVYCYSNNENSAITYVAANAGDQVIMMINAGGIEACCDDLFIYDGIGTGGALLYSGTGDVSGVTVQSTTGAITINIQSDGSWSCTDGLVNPALDYDIYCGTLAVLGCTDPTATNYDPAANTDDGSCLFCTDNLVELVVNPGSWPGEISWNVFDGGGALVTSGTGSTGSGTFCLVSDCYEFEMFDSFGDGWNGGSIDIYVGGTYQESVDVDSAELVVLAGEEGSSFVDIGNSGACPTFGCTDPTACNYDATATLDDGSCIAAPCINDLPSLAYALSMNSLGTCNGYVGEDMSAALIASTEGTAFTAGSGRDLWYSFVASTSGARIEVNTVAFDALIELQDASNNPVDVEDNVFVDGGEILNIGTLTAGDTYFVRVAPYFDVTGAASFDICVQEIPDTRCDYGPGPYDLCNVFKADWVGADDYIFNFTSNTDASVYTYQSGGPNTFVGLFNVAGLPWGDSYEVSINSVFDLTDGNGTLEAIEVMNDEPCSMTINPQPLSKLRDADTEANYGPHLITDYVQTTPWVCGTTDWEWEFVNTDGSQLPITHFRGSTNRWQRLYDVAGLQLGAVYQVRVRPIFNNGPGAYGPTELLSIIGPAGMVDEVVSPVVLDDQANRLDVVEAGDLTIYPNPNAGDAMTVSINGIASDVERVNVDIYDMAGKLVVSEQIASNGAANLQTQMSLVELTSGVYNVRITAGAIVMNERLVISK